MTLPRRVEAVVFDMDGLLVDTEVIYRDVMIEAAGLGVAYRAKPVVAAQADARVDHQDLTALLYFQGYGADEFV